MTRTKTIATLALAGAVTFSPLMALADTDASVQVNMNTGTHVTSHSILNSLKAHVDAKTNTHVDADATTSMKSHASSSAALHQAAAEQKHIEKQQDRGQNQVDKRISVLQKLEARINAMARLTASEKASLVADLDAQISVLNTLKAKIGNDTSTTTLIADLKSIRPDYRTYLLIMPRTAILAAANRVMNITDQMTAEGTKLDARIAVVKANGTDVSAAESAYADFQSKIADAKVQAQASIDLVKDLNVDKGDTATLQANIAALKSARTKLQAARQDLQAARKDMTSIMKVVGVKGSATATTTVSH